MKRVLNISYLVILVMIATFTSCEKDDFTGHSKLKPSNPTISVEGVNSAGYTLVEGGQKFPFTVKLSTAQISDVKLNIKQIGGDATFGADYNVESSVTIPAGATETTITVEVLSDDILEDTETLKLQIGDTKTANSTFTPITVNFTIQNYTEGDLAMEMSWATDIKTAIGIDAEPTDAVDMRFLLFHADSIYKIADGAAFESLTLGAADPDGEYLLATDIFATADGGDFNASLTIDVNLDFDQVGKINGMHLSYPAVMTNDFPCDAYRTYLAKVTKTGDDFAIEEDVSYFLPPQTEWYGKDAHFINDGNKVELASHVKTSVGCDLLIAGLNQEWMQGFWGETIIKEGLVKYTIADDGTVNIPSQYIFTTVYNDSEYPYSVSGTGTFDDTGAFPTMVINYSLSQDGFNPSGWCLANGYMDTDYFTATLTLDPDALINASATSSIGTSNKPARN